MQDSYSKHDKKREIAMAHAKDTFGTWALFDTEPRVPTATIIEDCRLLRITREDFFDVLSDRLQITQGVLRTLARPQFLTSEYRAERVPCSRTPSSTGNWISKIIILSSPPTRFTSWMPSCSTNITRPITNRPKLPPQIPGPLRSGLLRRS